MNTLLQRNLKSDLLKGKTVVLTGASRGIGLEISQVLGQSGARLIGIARSRARLESWAAEMNHLGVQAEAIAFDLASTEALPELTQQVKQRAARWGKPEVDILINNAGIEIYRAFSSYHPDEIERVIRINLLSVMRLTQLLLPLLSKRGHIINMASLAGKKGHPYDSIYAASKSGLLMWSHSLRQELAESGQAVSAICPGYVSDRGMLADTGIKAPFLAGRSPAKAVGKAVLKTIHHRRAEIIVNQNLPVEITTRTLLALEQLFPDLTDFSNRLLGITRSNRQRITAARESTTPESTIREPALKQALKQTL
ncbi:MAG: SDR family oxidoreductase [Cyanobacteria bacterium J06626_6]